MTLQISSVPVVFEADKESSSRTGKRRANRRRGTRCHRCVVRCFGEMRTKKKLAGVSRRLRGQPSIFSTLVRRNPAVPSLSSVPLRDEWYRSRPRKVFQKLPRMLRGLATGGKKIQTSRLEFFKSLKKQNFYCILNLQLSCPTLRKVQKKSRRDEGRSRRFFVSLCCRSRFFCVA